MNRFCHSKAEIHRCHELTAINAGMTTRDKVTTFNALPDCRCQTLPFLRQSKENKGISAFPGTYINIFLENN